ncbi:endoribonuclease MazF [soil metagenome]
MAGYVPEAGDIVWLEFDPQAGHEQAAHRPALVLSPSAYNGQRGMMICCPMTSRIKGYVFEVALPGGAESAVLVDQVESVDWVARRARKKAVAPAGVLAEVRARLKALLVW